MTNDQGCPINFPDQSRVEVVRLHPEGGVSGYQQAVALARGAAEQRFARIKPALDPLQLSFFRLCIPQ
jgi:hypothetical protein